MLYPTLEWLMLCTQNTQLVIAHYNYTTSHLLRTLHDRSKSYRNSRLTLKARLSASNTNPERTANLYTMG